MINKVLTRLASGFVSLLPRQKVASALTRMIQSQARKLPADEALRLLFQLDAEIYALVGPLATTYGGGIHTKHRHMRYHDFFIKRITSKERVIDIGCGTGSVAYDVAKQTSASVRGIDIDQENIRKAKDRFVHPNLEFAVEDGRVLETAKPYDVVILSNVLEHIEDRPAFLRQIAQATGAKRFLIRVPSFERDWRVPLKQELGVEWRLDLDHKTEYTDEEFKNDTRLAGLQIVHYEMRWGEIWSELKSEV